MKIRTDGASTGQLSGLSALTVEEKLSILSTIVMSLPEGMGFLDPDYRILLANEMLSEQLRMPLESIVNHTVEEVVPGWAHQVEHLYKTARDTGKPFYAEALPFQSARRGATYWDTVICPVFDQNNTFSGYLVFIRDVTERKTGMEERDGLMKSLQEINAKLTAANAQTKEEAERAESTNRTLRTLIDLIPAGLMVCDTTGTVTLTNLAAQEILGSPIKGSIYGSKGNFSLFHPDGSPFPGSEMPLSKAIERGEVTGNVEILVHRGDGSERTVLASGSPVRDSEGRIVSAVTVFQDITERKKTEEESPRLAAIVESSDDGIVAITLDGIVENWNQGAERLYGYTESEMKGNSVSILIPPDHPDELSQILARIRTGQRIHHHETARIRKDGKRIDISLSVSPVRNKKGEIVRAAWISHDITERKLAEQALQKAHDELEIRVQERTSELATANQRLEAEIAERKRTEESLRVSELRFRKVFEEGPLGMTIVGLDRRFLQANAMACQILGYTEQELKKLTFIDISYLEDIDSSNHLSEQLFKGEIPTFQTDKRYVRKNGEVVWANLTASIIRDTNGKPLYALGMLQDISERKKSEETLRQSEERYRMLLHSIPQKVFYKDRNSVYLAVNLSYARDFNLSPDDFVGKSDFDFYPPDLAEKYRSDDQKVMKSGETQELDESYIYDGEKRTVHTLKVPVRDNSGNVVGILGIFWDITDRVKAEEDRERLLRDIGQLAEISRRRALELETTIASIVDGVFVCDKEGLIVDANQAGLSLLGLTGQENPLRPFVDYLHLLHLRHPNGQPITTEELALTRALQGEIVRSYEEIARDRRNNRDVYLLVSAAPIRNEEGNIIGAVEVMSDITRIRQLDKLKDEFITVAAHELKTPIAIMKGYAQALLRNTEECSPQSRKMLEAINRGSDRIDHIVMDLLDISQLYLGRLEMSREKIDLVELAEEVIVRESATTARHYIRLVRADPVIVYGDRDRLEQVFKNLIDNAIRYSPAGGDIDIAVIVQKDEAVVSVTDHGVGIPKDKQERIFERFYRAHTGTPYDYGGMGVGLYISREIVEAHGGRMWFESEEGKGSTFYFSLPLQGENVGK